MMIVSNPKFQDILYIVQLKQYYIHYSVDSKVILCALQCRFLSNTIQSVQKYAVQHTHLNNFIFCTVQRNMIFNTVKVINICCTFTIWSSSLDQPLEWDSVRGNPQFYSNMIWLVTGGCVRVKYPISWFNSATSLLQNLDEFRTGTAGSSESGATLILY